MEFTMLVTQVRAGEWVTEVISFVQSGGSGQPGCDLRVVACQRPAAQSWRRRCALCRIVRAQRKARARKVTYARLSDILPACQVSDIPARLRGAVNASQEKENGHVGRTREQRAYGSTCRLMSIDSSVSSSPKSSGFGSGEWSSDQNLSQMSLHSWSGPLHAMRTRNDKHG